MLSRSLRGLTRTAADLADQIDDGETHAVAAAFQTQSGAVVTGVNLFHFLGGPCAEVTAVANHAASFPDDPVRAVVAVHGGHDVIPPCGKCRQVLHDLDPSIECVIRAEDGYRAVPVRELLPYAFGPQSLEKQQRLCMWEGYEDLIRRGVKQQTIRVDDPFRTGPATLVFEKGSGDVVTIPASVTAVETTTRGDLTDLDARRDGFADLAELHAALDEHYPGLASDEPVDLVSFTVNDNE